MEPIRRPFAEWVERRVMPSLEDGPPWWTGLLLFVLVEGALQALLRRWGFLLEMGAAVVAILVLKRAVNWDRWRRWRRIEAMRANHICLHCGYDMRATPERCPECGRQADEGVEV